MAILNPDFVLAMSAPQGGSNPLLGLLPAALILGIFYFILLLPMRRRQKKVQAFLAALKIGDRVVTSGGIFGTIVKVEDDHLKIEIADRVRVDMSRNAVVGYQGQERVVPEPGSNA
ncbi:MAG: preprotein translocase subunit YajC [Vicinamibacterales bacterium]|nr:preprotein translocase subunit YajC [Vicinamibacterales bacterium]